MADIVVNNKNKTRLDIKLVELGIFDSREKAKIAIMEGLVYVNNQKEDKAGTLVKNDAIVEYRGQKQKYVSRGGYKLEKAIEVYNIDLNNKICMDIGSSTGGFTDCMLQNGAKKVFAIDCGTNQLDYSLRIDERVVSMENFNARYLTLSDINNESVDFVSIDVSFISLTKILPAVIESTNENAEIVALIKPQFEAGKDKVDEGIVKNKNIHIEVIKMIADYCIDNKLCIKNLTYSPIKGPKGNIEFLIYLTKDKAAGQYDIYNNIEKIVEDAHLNL